MLVALRILSFELDPRDGRVVLLLAHDVSRRVFPLWLGDDDAAIIARSIGALPPIPDSAQLLSAALQVLGASIDHVEITSVAGGVVSAVVVLADARELVSIAARASDAIAVAIRLGAQVLIADALLAKVAQDVAEAEARVHAPVAAQPVVLTQAERWSTLLQHLNKTPQKTYPT